MIFNLNDLFRTQQLAEFPATKINVPEYAQLRVSRKKVAKFSCRISVSGGLSGTGFSATWGCGVGL